MGPGSAVPAGCGPAASAADDARAACSAARRVLGLSDGERQWPMTETMTPKSYGRPNFAGDSLFRFFLNWFMLLSIWLTNDLDMQKFRTHHIRSSLPNKKLIRDCYSEAVSS